MRNIAVYSAITGEYEPIKNAQNTSGADWYMFTDYQQKSSVWVQRPAIKLFIDPRRNARWHKANSFLQFPDYEYTIWIDGSMELETSPLWIIQNYLKNADIAVFKHPLRNCLYDEADIVVAKGFVSAGDINRQIERYKLDKYPKSNGLAETKIVVRRNNERVKMFEMLWNNELTNNTPRDQVSFNYCAWKADLMINYIPVEVINHEAVYPNFRYIKHERR